VVVGRLWAVWGMTDVGMRVDVRDDRRPEKIAGALHN